MSTLTDLQQRTVEVVTPHRKENPITGVKIAAAIGLKERKSGKEGADMRSIIHALRVKGYPICANGKGYYWPENKQELYDFVQSLQARADDVLAAVEGLGQGYPLLGGPGAVEAVKRGVVKQYLDGNTVYTVTGANEERFLKEHPNAKLV